MTKNKLLLKNMSLVSLGIMVSRILGYLRDMLVASVFGAGFYADAFYAAFRIPNLFRRLFGESSLNAAFVPVFSEKVQTDTKQQIEKLISAVVTVLFVFLSSFTILGIIFAPQITKIITWGFEKEKLVLTSQLLQIMFPFMLLICLAALGLSILNCLGVFFIPAMSSASLSIAEIVFVLFIVNHLPKEEWKVKGLAVSVLIGGILQLVINFYLLFLKNYRFSLMIKQFFYFLSLAEIKKISILFFPVVVGFSADQINALVDTLCASFLSEGSITALYYSNRLMQLPLALFGTALVTVSLPQMSKEIVYGTYEDIKETIVHSFRNTLFFMLPAMIGLVLLGKPIISVLFEHGKFTHKATLMTYSCLMFYALGLPFFSTTKILTSAFYALKMPNLPVKIAFVSLMLNIVLNVILMQFLEVGGLALASTISSLFCSILLFTNLKKIMNTKFLTPQLKKFIIKIFFVNIIFAIIVSLISLYFKTPGIITLLSVGLGIIIYFGLTWMMKIEETKILTSFIYRFIYASSHNV